MHSDAGTQLFERSTSLSGSSGRGASPTTRPSRAPLVTVDRLTRSYGPRPAVRSVSFELGVGVTGLLGPNGAGKSSLLTCLAGIAAWDEGSITIGGLPLRPHRGQARALVGYTPERVAFPLEMRVRGYLAYAARAKHVPRGERADAVEEALARAELTHVADRVLGNLSKGYRQRVGLAQALLGNPMLAVLDEPSSGLDPLNMMQVRAMLRDYAKDRAVLISTHQLGDARLLCDRVIVMSAGRVMYDGTPAGMAVGADHGTRVRLDVHGLVAPLPTLPGVSDVTQSSAGAGRSVTATFASTQVLGQFVRELSLLGQVVAVEPTTDALESAFRVAVGVGSVSEASLVVTSPDPTSRGGEGERHGHDLQA